MPINLTSTRARRLGRFTVLRCIIDDIVDSKASHDAAAAWCALFGKCIIIEATHRYDQRAIEYLAYCEDFNPLEEHIEAPHYHATISRKEDFIAGQRIVTFDGKFTPTK